MELVECYDVGGTKILGALIDSNQKIIASRSCKTIKGDTDKFIEQIKNLSNSLRADIFSMEHSKDILAISLGLPGPVENGMLMESPPMNLYSKLDLVSELSKFIKEPIYVDNDLNTAVRAELHLGIGKRVKNFYLLTISTGIGAGIVIDGKVLTGSCGEFGHSILERDMNKANKCSCGRYGCWGAMSSGYGTELTVKKEIGKDLAVEDLFRMYADGDKKAEEIVERIRDYNAHGIGNMINAFSVDAIVIMGSVGLNQFRNVIPSSEQIKRYTINRVPEIVPTNLGDEIGVLGAYMLARERL